MATWQHLRSSTANKRPTTSLADGRIAINTNTASPGLFFKDSAGTGIVKVGPVHVGTTAPNSVPAAGGSSGNYTGEQWLDTSVSPAQMKVWNGSTWVGIVADELPVSKLQDGAARQLIQTDAAGTGVEWTSDVDVPGTLDVTSTATFDSIAQHPLGTAGAPTITFTGDNNTGIYSPGADQVAISTGGTGRLFVNSSGRVSIGTSSFPDQFTISNGGAGGLEIGTSTNAPILQAYNRSGAAYVDLIDSCNNRIFRTGNDSERLRITSAGLVGVGTSSPSEVLTVAGNIRVNNSNPTLGLYGANGTSPQVIFGNSAGTAHYSIYETTDPSTGTRGSLNIYDLIAAANRVTVDTSGRVGVGTTSPSTKLHVAGSGQQILRIQDTGNTNGFDLGNNTTESFISTADNKPITFYTNNLERAKIDSSGRLLVGTSSARAVGTAQLLAQIESTSANLPGLSITQNGADTAAGYLFFGKSRGTSAGSNTLVADGDRLGGIRFAGADGTDLDSVGAQIEVFVDGTPGANDMPGRLVFSVTQDGNASPSERYRISNAGQSRWFASSADAAVFGSASAAGTSDRILIGLHSATMSSGTTCFQVYTNGNVENTNNSYGAISDLKLKENIVNANPQWDDIKALQVRNYNFKEGQTHTQIGLVAQEVELVSPGLVTESPDRDAEGNDLGTVTKSVNYSVLYMKAVKALQEAMERIEQLEQRLTDAGIA